MSDGCDCSGKRAGPPLRRQLAVLVDDEYVCRQRKRVSAGEPRGGRTCHTRRAKASAAPRPRAAPQSVPPAPPPGPRTYSSRRATRSAWRAPPQGDRAPASPAAATRLCVSIARSQAPSRVPQGARLRVEQLGVGASRLTRVGLDEDCADLLRRQLLKWHPGLDARAVQHFIRFARARLDKRAQCSERKAHQRHGFIRCRCVGWRSGRRGCHVARCPQLKHSKAMLVRATGRSTAARLTSRSKASAPRRAAPASPRELRADNTLVGN